MKAARWQIAAACAALAIALAWAFWPSSTADDAGGSASSSAGGGKAGGGHGSGPGSGVASGALGEALGRGENAAGLSGRARQSANPGPGRAGPGEKSIYLWGRAVQKGTDEPVPLAVVTVLMPRGVEVAQVTADTLGRFRVDGLKPGQFRVKAQAGGFTMNPVRVEALVSREVNLELFAASYIEGQVVTADGKPARGAEVFAVGADDSASGTATETGSFSIEVAPHSWTVAARRGEESGKADAPVTVAAGATARGVKIRLGAAPGISGVVVAAVGGQGVPGAQVNVSPHNLNGNSGGATTDASGNFAVKGLAPGSYDVDVTADGWLETSRRGVTLQEGQKFPLRIELHRTGAIEGVVRDGALHGVPNAVVRASGRPVSPAAPLETRADGNGAYHLAGLAPGRGQFTALRDGSAFGAVAGADVPEGGSAQLDFQLKDEGLVAGHVRRKDGTPAPPDVSVRVFPMGPRLTRGPDFPGGIPIDASGAYAASLPAGGYAIGVGRGDAMPMRGRGFVTVEAGKTATQDLSWSDPADDPQGFGGTVVEPDGSPSPGAALHSDGRGGAYFFGIVSDENGRFHIDRARTDLPDTFELRASNGGRTGQAQVAPQQQDVVVRLLAAAVLRGHLSGGGADSFRVDVTVAGDRGLYMPRATQSLEFTGDRFEMDDVPGMPVHVAVTTQDGRSAAVDAELSPGAVKEVEIPLQPLAQVTGRLVDAATQQPLPDARVFVDGATQEQRPAITGGDGHFQLRASAGTRSLSIMLQGYRGNRKPFTAVAGQVADLGDVALQRQTAQPGTVGMTLRGDSDTPPTVIFLVTDGPADKAGVHLGDQVTAVDGKPVTGQSDAVSQIQGAPGTPVQIAVLRSGTALAFTITRAP